LVREEVGRCITAEEFGSELGEEGVESCVDPGRDFGAWWYPEGFDVEFGCGSGWVGGRVVGEEDFELYVSLKPCGSRCQVMCCVRRCADEFHS
jgi:hypothetical protein